MIIGVANGVPFGDKYHVCKGVIFFHIKHTSSMKRVLPNLLLSADRGVHIGKYHCQHSNADSVPTQVLSSAKFFGDSNTPLLIYYVALPASNFVVVSRRVK